MANSGKNKNVLGEDLIPCSVEPLTGFYRDGHCRVGPDDQECHAICCVMTSDFLDYSKAAGNDLSRPMPAFGFPGLKPGDHWCVCAARWVEAHAAGHACPVILEATSAAALQYVSRSVLEEFAIVKED